MAATIHHFPHHAARHDPPEEGPIEQVIDLLRYVYRELDLEAVRLPPGAALDRLRDLTDCLDAGIFTLSNLGIWLRSRSTP